MKNLLETKTNDVNVIDFPMYLNGNIQIKSL